MKKFLFVFSVILMAGSLCFSLDSCSKKKKGGGGGGGDDDSSTSDSIASDSLSRSRTERTRQVPEEQYDYAEEATPSVEGYEEETSRDYYGESRGKNAEIEQWLTILSKRYLNEADIDDLPVEDLTLIRNLVFANHGYIFKEARFKHFFSKYEWYEPLYENSGYVSSLFNKFETYNVNFLLNHEARMV